MKQFQNILYVSQGTDSESGALKYAVKLMEEKSANLKILITYPTFPENLRDYQTTYENAFKEKIINRVNTLFPQCADKIEIEIQNETKPQVAIIQHVLRHKNDLLIKDAQIHESGKGFKALDMDLLRKCPCPVLLYRDNQHHKEKTFKIAVAIDPETQETAGYDLAVKLATLSDQFTQQFQAELTFVSCWDYEFEHYLQNNAFVHISDEDVAQTVNMMKMNHLNALNQIIDSAKLKSSHQVKHIRGIPETVIPKLIEEEKINLLIMGTVARTGFTGFIIGNTAENMLHKIDCSLLALKPAGFISPIKI